MKTLAIGMVACALMVPASLEAASPSTGPAGEKFTSVVPVNYARVGGGMRGSYGGAYGGNRGAYGGNRGAYGGYRGGNAYRGGYYGRGYYGGRYGYGYGYRYPYYGYRGYGGWSGGYYPYWGYYGYPYAAAFAYGLGWPLAYSAGYYANSAPYAYNQQPVYVRRVRTASSSRSSGGSFVTNVQSALKSRGYYTGSVDGNFGPASQQAMASFQQASGLTPTGTLEQPALVALGVSGKIAKSSPTPVVPRKTAEGTFVAPPTEAPATAPGVQIEPPPIAAPTAPSAVTPMQPPPIPGG